MNLRIGLSALQASQYAIGNVSQNLANASTEGYHRQEVLFKTSRADFVRGRHIGSGVEISHVRRIREFVVESAYTNSTADLSRVEQSLNIESRIEQLITPGEGSVQFSLDGLIDEFSKLSSNPGERSLRNSVLNQATNLTDRVRETYGDLVELKQDVQHEIELEVDALNRDIEALVDLQNRIRSELHRGVPNNLFDQRDQLINQIAERVDVQRFEFVQEELGLGLAGSSISIGIAPIKFEAVTDSDGIVEIRVGDREQSVEFVSGRLAGLVEANNYLVDDYTQRIDTFATELVRQFDQLHAVGIGIDGSFQTLQGVRPVTDVDAPLSESASFSIQQGELFVTMTTPSGEHRTESIAIDPDVDSLNDVATRISGIANVQALVDGATGSMTIIAEPGYQFDFTGRLESAPDLSSFTGTTRPAITGSYDGTTNQTYTVTATSAGVIGKTAGLQAEVTDSLGNVVQVLDIGEGYEAGSAIDLGDGVSVSFGVGDIANADSFDVVMVAESDTTGFLSAVGMNNFFTGSSAADIGVDERFLKNPEMIASSRTGEVSDTGNLDGLVGIRDRQVLADGRLTFGDYLAEANSDIGFRVQSSQSVQVSLSELKFHYQSERDAKSGVDVNEELINLTEHQKTYEAAIQVVRTMEAMLDELFQIVR